MNIITYLIIVNVIGLILSLLDVKVFRTNSFIQVILMIIGAIGGSVGILLPILILDRKPKKENMMLRVFLLCMLIIQIVMIIFYKGNYLEDPNFNFIAFFNKYRFFGYYLIIVNIITFIIYGLDKLFAKKNKRRISIVALFTLAFIGGSIGALIAMYVFKHKTQKPYFTVGIPLIIVMQLVVLFVVMNICL